MRKKLKEYSRRFLSVLLCISIFCVFVISPVYAADYSLNLIDLLDYQDNISSSSANDGFHEFYDLKFPNFTNFFYFEYYFYYDGPFGSFNTTISVGSQVYQSAVIPLGYNLCKGYFYGYTGGSSVRINFHSLTSSPVSGTILYECKYSTVDVNPVSLPYQITGFNYGNSGQFSSAVEANNTFTIPSQDDDDQNFVAGFDFTIYISPSDWKSFDSINMRFDIRSTSIDSCIVRLGNRVLPSSLSLTNSLYEIPPVFDDNYIGYGVPTSHYTLDIDLSDVVLSSNDFISIQVTGTYSFGYSYSSTLGIVYFVSGLRSNDGIDPIIFWFRRVNNHLSTWFADLGNFLGGKLDSILNVLNGDSSEVKQAQQTQEEVNVSINNQLVGAVEDWNTNIEVVETGYDLAVSKTTPALVWLSSLADGIFNGMGWFGNVYFLVGLISVIMLLLSKSGLAHRIGSINRRKGG